jgi:PAS domain-containing protein
MVTYGVPCLAFIYYFVPPTYSFAVETAQIPRAALFAPAALLVGSLSARQRSAGEALRKSEQRYRDYIETLSDWLWETGLDHRFTQISVLGFEGQRRVGEQRQDFATDVEEEPEKWRLEWGRGHAGGPAGAAQDGCHRDGRPSRRWPLGGRLRSRPSTRRSQAG